MIYFDLFIKCGNTSEFGIYIETFNFVVKDTVKPIQEVGLIHAYQFKQIFTVEVQYFFISNLWLEYSENPYFFSWKIIFLLQ
ncbi:MAG: hypothetical protein A7316_09095 [Candidatus Altiarchaeales archaeon WOR_SM1_86-2]|nr:MAG: hypothetical protein A7316_09095 [Candidatus Altiarchaeales archaeon WOR_SM1_86-2]